MRRRSSKNDGPTLPGFVTCEPSAVVGTVATVANSDSREPAQTASSSSTNCPPSTCLSQDSHAKTSVMQGKARASQVREAVCGTRLTASLAKYDHESSCWRTSELCLDGDFEKFSDALPPSGMMLGGELFPLRPLEHLTSANGSSSSRGIETPPATEPPSQNGCVASSQQSPPRVIWRGRHRGPSTASTLECETHRTLRARYRSVGRRQPPHSRS